MSSRATTSRNCFGRLGSAAEDHTRYGIRHESTDRVLRTTSISPGYVQTELVDSLVDPAIRKQKLNSMASLGIPAVAVARAIGFAIEQPDDVEIGDLTIRPTRQG
jgi:NADP-dependent 3-hydroxy acid dehydrogenase YdfG